MIIGSILRRGHAMERALLCLLVISLVAVYFSASAARIFSQLLLLRRWLLLRIIGVAPVYFDKVLFDE